MQFSILAITTLLISSCYAGVFTTFPVASTSIVAGTPFNITWQADVASNLPLASSYGPSTVSLYTGSSQVQFQIINFGTIQNLVTTNSMMVTIPATAGPNSSLYFIRFESLNSTLTAPIQAFSARFTLTGMTGTFTAAQLAANAASNPSSSLVPITSAVPTTPPSSPTTTTTSSNIITARPTTSTAITSPSAKTTSGANKLNSMTGGFLMGIGSLIAFVL